MPAVLVEGGFLTNPTEALMLADPAVRQAIAEAIGRGIAAYAAAGVVAPPDAAAHHRPVVDEAADRAGRLPAGEDRGGATRWAGGSGSA